jgi:hypothetical protein
VILVSDFIRIATTNYIVSFIQVVNNFKSELNFNNYLYTVWDPIMYAHGRHTLYNIGLMMVAKRATEICCQEIVARECVMVI